MIFEDSPHRHIISLSLIVCCILGLAACQKSSPSTLTFYPYEATPLKFKNEVIDQAHHHSILVIDIPERKISQQDMHVPPGSTVITKNLTPGRPYYILTVAKDAQNQPLEHNEIIRVP